MERIVLSLLVDNTSGVLSRVAGLFSRRGYNIESLTVGVTADERYSRMTVVSIGDQEILDQIEKQLRKLEDVRDIKELKPGHSVYRELIDPICIRYRDERNKIQSDSGKQRVRGIRKLHQDFIFLIHVPQIIYTGIEQYGNIRRAHHSVSGVWKPVSGASAGPAAGTAEGDFPDDLFCILFRFRNRCGGGVRMADEGKRRLF